MAYYSSSSVPVFVLILNFVILYYLFLSLFLVAATFLIRKKIRYIILSFIRFIYFFSVLYCMCYSIPFKSITQMNDILFHIFSRRFDFYCMCYSNNLFKIRGEARFFLNWVHNN